MSSGCGDVLSLADLQTAKKHQIFEAEVITGKSGGVAGGADIDYATNQVTGQTQKTLPAVIADADADFDAQILSMGFTRVGTFAAGATLTNPRQTLLWDVANGGDGQEYGWSGAFPKVVPAASAPASTGGISVGAWISRFDPELRIAVREVLRRSYSEVGYNLVAGSFEAGATVTTATDVLLHESKGKAYSYSGTLPRTVAAGSTPSEEPEVWLDRSDELNAVKQVGAVSIATINTSIAGMADGELTIPPGEYAINGDVIIQLKNNESTTGPFGSFRLNAEGVRFTGSGNIIVDSCKRLTIVGIDAPNHNLILRGCWWSNFEGMRFKYLILSDVAGTAFASNYWCQWTNCQFQSIKTGAASTFNNKFDWYSCSIRGNANQGFSGPADYAFEFNANANAQAWVFWGGDISYHNIAVYNVGAGNTNGDIELTFDGTYFDTLTPAPINRARSRVQTKKCHYSNSTTSLPNSAKMQAVARGGQDMFRQDRSAGWAQFSAINFIPDGDFRVGLPTYVGAGRPIGASGGAAITEESGAIFGRYLNINQAGTSGTTRFRPGPLPFTGRYTAAIIIRNADPGARTIRLGFNNLYEVAEISNTDWTFWTLTVGADIAAGQQPDIQILTNDATPFNVDVCYAAVTFGEGGQPMVAAPAVSELLGSVSYNPPSMATGTGASTTITVNGAELGDFAIPSFGIDLQGIQMWAQVTSANTVTVFFRNETGATIDSLSSTLRVRVVKATYV